MLKTYKTGGANMKNSQSQIDFIFESIIFYPSEIHIFYKIIKNIKSIYKGNTTEDFEKYLIYLEDKFKPFFQNICDGKISSVNMIFHIYELLYVCAIIDAYMIENDFELTPKEEKYLQDILERFELLYYKYFSKIKKFCHYPIKRKKYILKKIQQEKERFFNVQ